MAKTLVIVSHPNIKDSNINAYLMGRFKELADTKVIHIDSEKCTYPLDAELVKKYQKDLVEAEKIIFEFPVWWYTAPPSLLSFVDSIFELGFAYKYEGDKMLPGVLEGKKLYVICTVGGTEEEYKKGGECGPVADYMKPYEGIAAGCGMKYMGNIYLASCPTGKVPMTVELEEKFAKFFDECKKFIE